MEQMLQNYVNQITKAQIQILCEPYTYHTDP